MRHLAWALVLALTACTSAEEKARQREAAMIEQARADSASEADFVADSVALAASITLDTVRELRIRDVRREDEDDGETYTEQQHEAVGTNGLVCGVTSERYVQIARGDTLSCQWGPPQ